MKAGPECKVSVLAYQFVDPTPIFEGKQIVTFPQLNHAKKFKIILQLLFNLGEIRVQVADLLLILLRIAAFMRSFPLLLLALKVD